MNKSPLPVETARAERRRRQILDAATRCFALRGFHATSIAQIGAEAGMSVGHIYRYFTNKEAIIAGIVRSHLDDAQALINDIAAQSDDLQATLIECAERGVDKAMDPRQSVLMIEVKAEAARNPALAAILHAADTEMRQHLTALLRQARPGGWSEDDIAMRAEIMALTFEGLPLRAIANPTLGRDGMVRLMQTIIRQLLA